MLRSNCDSAAALRDNTGRTYVAIPVKAGTFEIDSLLAVLTVAKASQITGIEAVVIAGQLPAESSIQIVKSVDSSALILQTNSEDQLSPL